MSGDVQPRKRKDKKKKRESLDFRKSEGELIFSRKSSLQDDEASHGVHVTKMGSDDVLLHVHEEHGTGGHWCAKIIFFALMALLMGLVCLIILENRGLSDLDTPLSESRFSNYFDGWVDEHRDEHGDHHDNKGSIEHDDHDNHDEDDEHDEEDDHGEPFEEEIDHSEGDEDEVEQDDDNVTPEEEEEDGDNATAENVTPEEEEDEDEDEDDEDNITAEIDDNITAEEEADNDNVTEEDENVTNEQDNNNDDDDDDDQDDGDNNNKATNDDDDDEDDEDDNATKEILKPVSQAAHDDDDDAFDEEDDDGTTDSFERIVDNDAAELELLKEKAREQAAAESKQNVASPENDIEDEADSAPSWATSQIKAKTGSGPQSIHDDGDFDSFEQELRRANDEMMREFNYH